MTYKYDKFITQNIAPKKVKKIGVYDSNNNRIGSIMLNRLLHTSEEKKYSFGLISDLHFYSTDVAWNPITKVDNALSYFENNNCSFCCHTGDMTQTGFYNEGDTTTLQIGQFQNYKTICNKHTIQMYGICGNHESYVNPIKNNLTELKTYTNIESLHYSISYNEDIFIFISQPQGTLPMTDEALQWLYQTLETNRNKRCFVFVHPYLDCGNTNNLYGNDIFSWWGTKTTAFKNLLKHYENTLLFHGHSHNNFKCQEIDKIANYNENTGFKSIHIPSVSRPTKIVDGVRSNDDTQSYGYLVDVYENFIILNGIDFINNKPVPLGTYKIDTTLVNVKPNTFVDSTGTITT